MKILHVIPSYLPAYSFGGPIKSTHQLCRELVKENIEVTVYTTNVNQDKDLGVSLNESVDIEGVKVWYFKVNKPRFWAFSYSLWKEIKKNIKLFDLVHIHLVYLFPAACASYYARRFKIPYIISPRGVLDPAMIKKKGFLKKKIYIQMIEKNNLENASLIHATSELEKEQILSLGLKIKNIVTIPLGIDTNEFKEVKTNNLKEKYPELKNKKIILFLSRVNWKKGLDILISSFAKVLKIRSDVHLLIVGPEDEGYSNRVKFWINKENINNNVTFTGLLLGKEKLEAFYGSNIFVLPSLSENLGIAPIEAMYCKLPVIITNHVGIYNEVEKNETGLVIDYGIDSLYKAILKALDDEVFCKRMGENGRRLVEEKFTWNKIIIQMLRLYESILKNNG